MDNENIRTFFADFLGSQEFRWISLPQSGSDRRNFVAKTHKRTYIVTANENTAENEAFLYFSEIFSELQLSTPKIFKVSKDRKIYIQDFVGEKTLFECITTQGQSLQVENLVKNSLEQLYLMQTKTLGKVDFKKTFEYEAYDEIPISHDLFYFKFMFVDLLDVPYHKGRLLKEFKNLVSLIENLEPKGLMIRDFQSRNIMVNANNEVHFIDYQSAMRGPMMYDVISFLYQAKANFSKEFRRKMLYYYYQFWKDENTKRQLNDSVMPIKLIRFLQVLGAYGFRGLVQRKPHFLESINQGIENISEFSNEWDEMDKFPELLQIIKSLKSENVKSKLLSY